MSASIYLTNKCKLYWYNLGRALTAKGNRINLTVQLKIHYGGWNSTIRFLTILKVGLNLKKII